MKFGALDGWRGVCALLVVLYHLPLRAFPCDETIVRNGYLCVDFFFVLSGFVIGYSYHDRLGTPRELAVFGLRRFGRLWPLHITLLGAYVLLECSKSFGLRFYGASISPPFSGPTSIPLLLANVALVQTLWPEPTESWNIPAWSISVEYWTYFVFGSVLVFLPRARAAIAVALSIASVTVLYVFSNRNINVTANLAFFRCFYGFFLGYLLFHFARPKPASVTSNFLPTLIEIAAAAAAAGFVIFAGNTRYSLFSSMIFAGVVLVFAKGKGAISGLLEAPFFQLIGRLSYSIYLVHELLILVLERMAHLLERKLSVQLVTPGFGHGGGSFDVLVRGRTWESVMFVVAFAALLIAISAVTYRFIERPGAKLVNRLVENRKVPTHNGWASEP